MHRRVKQWISGLLPSLPGGEMLLSALRAAYRRCKRLARAVYPLVCVRGRTEAYLRLGDSWRREGCPGLAVTQYGKAVRRKPTPQGYLRRGHALRALGRLAEACRDFRAALALPTVSVEEVRELHAQLSSVLAELGGTGEALFHGWACRLPHAAFPPHDAEGLQALIEAHDVLAEDVINRRADFDTALDLYRRKRAPQRRLAAVIGETEEDVLCLPDDWVRNIGHMALLDYWVKMRKLGWRSWRRMVLLAPPGGTANTAYRDYWKKYFTVVTEPEKVRQLAPLAAACGNRVAGLLSLPEGREAYFGDGVGAIQEEWEARGLPPLLELTAGDRERGRETLRQLGVPEGAWFVSLHVRSSGFHGEGGDPDQAHRNADVRSYLPAVRHIFERGGWVVRLGDRTMPMLPHVPGLIDYAHSPWKSPWMDVFFCAACRFFIGGPSGLAQLPSTFGVPCALTNWVTSPLPVCGRRDLFIPKLIRAEAGGRLLTFEEAFGPGVGKLSYCGGRFAARGLRPVENTAEEILELVREMFAILENPTAGHGQEDPLRRRFRAAAGRCGLIGFGNVGLAFLCRYAHLLPHDVAPEPSPLAPPPPLAAAKSG